MEDKKRDYLIRTFSRTNRKDYENYIINAIWHKLGRDDIKPVTQQYIKRSDGRYALVDLYFPQLNIAVECDEAHHIKKYDNDMTREIAIKEMLSSYEETSDILVLRVIAYDNLDSINEQIVDILEKINERINQRKYSLWNVDENYIKLVLEKGNILVSDNLPFKQIKDICQCFGRNPKRMQKSYFKISNDYQLWCPKLAKYKDGESVSVSDGWKNELSNDWEVIIESNDNPEKTDITNLKNSVGRKRIVFAQSKDNLGNLAYKFIGVFQINLDKCNNRKRVYERICDEIQILPFLSL